MVKKTTQTTTEAPARKGHPFLLGCLIGLLIGIVIGWWFRPPESFPVDDLRHATEKKFLETRDQSRQKLADFTENLATQLRDE